jgi:beta-lactamase class A
MDVRLRVAMALSLLAGLAVAGLAPLPMPVVGRLVDVHGRPLAGISISTPLLGVRARTDRQGGYRMLAWTWPWPAGVGVQGPDLQPLTAFGGTTIVHRLPRAYGRVVDDEGVAIPGAAVWVVAADGSTHLVRADREGAFAFPMGVAPGHALITAVAPDHDQTVVGHDLRLDSQVRVSIALPRLLATLEVASDPPGVQVTIDGAPAPDCPATPCTPRVPIGSHTIGLANSDYVPWTQSVRLDVDQVLPLRIHLERKTGTLAVTAPAGGELTIDGRQVATGSWTGTVPTGQHQLAFRGPRVWPAVAGVQVQWNQTVSAQLAADAVAGDPGGFTTQLQRYLQTAGGDDGVYLEDLASGQSMGAGQDTPLEAASVIKLPAALYLLHQVDAGQVDLSDQVQLESDDFMGGTGTLYGKAHAGDRYSVRDLLTLMIEQSDNTAWQALRRVLDGGRIDSYAASLGAPGCEQASDQCTARGAGVLLGRLARGQALSPASGQLLLGLLESTVFNDRINYYLPGVTIAHKVGMDGDVMNDAGIVYLSGHPFLIAVLTRTSNPDTGVQIIRDVARAAAAYYGG